MLTAATLHATRHATHATRHGEGEPTLETHREGVATGQPHMLDQTQNPPSVLLVHCTGNACS